MTDNLHSTPAEEVEQLRKIFIDTQQAVHYAGDIKPTLEALLAWHEAELAQARIDELEHVRDLPSNVRYGSILNRIAVLKDGAKGLE